MEKIIERLKTIQEEEKLTDQQFAKKLGLKRNSSWNRIKNGKVPVSDKLLFRAYRAYHDRGIFLPQNARNPDKDALFDATERPQNHSLAALWGRLKGFFLPGGNGQ